MTSSLPDWLVERAALDEVAPHSRARIDRADSRELAERIAELRAENDAELAAHPAGPAVSQIEQRAATARRDRSDRARRRRIGLVGVMSAATVLVVVLIVNRPKTEHAIIDDGGEEVTRTKGVARLSAFRLVDDRVEKLEQDALVKEGDIIQLRYNPGGQAHGVIASIDGAGVATLHFPTSEDGPTALDKKATPLPNAYALDDAPRFERFFFITSEQAIDVPQSMAALRTLASRNDSASAAPELGTGLKQWSLRLRKGDRHPAARQPEDRHD